MVFIAMVFTALVFTAVPAQDVTPGTEAGDLRNSAQALRSREW